jgi:adenine-specific DNA-methyltransferase
LETVAKYDNPPIKGITGTRAEVTRGNNLLSSGFCKKDKVFGCLSNLIEDANFKFIVLSYSNHGILSEEEIVSIFEKFGNKSTLEVQRIPYRQYKRITGTPTKELHELIFSIEK